MRRLSTTMRQRQPDSMAKRFARDYLLISLVPLLILSLLVLVGTRLSGGYVSDLIKTSTAQLNRDAEEALQNLGERMIVNKARDVAKQLEIYFRMHPDHTFDELRNDPLFMEIAVQEVGDTGYTAVTERETYLFRVHPNTSLNDRDMRDFADKVPDWWQIAKAAMQGGSGSGYYDWIEPDGAVREKFLAISPVGVPVNGKTLDVSATTYIDEFSVPAESMKQKAERMVSHYHQYVYRQWGLFGTIAAAVLILVFSATYYFGRRAGLRYILPIMQLAESARGLGEGKWEVAPSAELSGRKDEIGILAGALQEMSAQLSELFNRLEQRLKELKKTQRSLQEREVHFRSLYKTSKRAEALYRSLIHSSADAIIIYDIKGCVTYVSPAFSRLFEWGADELIGSPLDFVPPSEKAETRRLTAGIIKEGTLVQGFETRRLTRSGRVIDVSISASRFADHTGNPSGVLVILRDISERKQLEAQLQHVEKMEAIGTLAGGIAHDFNNLLMVIQGSASLLKQKMATDGSSMRLIANIEDQVEKGSGLTNQLLGYARKGKYEIRVLHLNDLVRESAEAIARTRKDIAVHYDLGPNLSTIEADAGQIEQMLLNLYINAADAMPEGGSLHLRTRNISAGQLAERPYTPKADAYVWLEATDTGIGMDENTLERIFEPFFTTKETGKGTGLGLASVYGIVKGHGGYIDVFSEPGRGSRFSVYLPASGKEAFLPESKEPAAAEGKGTILLVDDEPVVLEVGTQILQTLGYDVLALGSGREAVEVYAERNQDIDLIILDMIMPDMSGGETFARLREIRADAPVLLSSGYSMDGKAEEIMNQGCRGFIQKPYTIEQLAAKIEASLHR